ncbi:hypothetical protein FA13DRAFT_1732250 [Coprinellus micaceus]|uniref:Uncharacterized protein n=1 Tax=Coprinellus micaceus TaxID=71717 RepID=A0A4Y7TEI2_COPMI|nr:hypothetical protein FA13DRAFT_1732250 [Coprinellus micaceus]
MYLILSLSRTPQCQYPAYHYSPLSSESLSAAIPGLVHCLFPVAPTSTFLSIRRLVQLGLPSPRRLLLIIDFASRLLFDQWTRKAPPHSPSFAAHFAQFHHSPSHFSGRFFPLYRSGIFVAIISLRFVAHLWNSPYSFAFLHRSPLYHNRLLGYKFAHL